MGHSDVTISFGGHVSKGATLRDANGTPVENFTVRAGSGDAAEFVECSLSGRRGEALAEYLKQRMPVHVTGRLGRSVYEGVTTLTCNVAEIALLSNLDALQREKEHYQAQRDAKRHQQQELPHTRPAQEGKRNRMAEGWHPDDVIDGPPHGRKGNRNG